MNCYPPIMSIKQQVCVCVFVCCIYFYVIIKFLLFLNALIGIIQTKLNLFYDSTSATFTTEQQYNLRSNKNVIYIRYLHKRKQMFRMSTSKVIFLFNNDNIFYIFIYEIITRKIVGVKCER